jgi:transcription elongation GreA/GreB family factor
MAHEDEREAEEELREAERELKEAEHRAETEIIVNARPREVLGHTVTFEQIVQLAFPGPQPPNTVFSMTYRDAASKPNAGELGPGGGVQVKNGTIFNVTKTVQS